MLKEIYEQPAVVRNCLDNYINPNWHSEENPEYSPISLGLTPNLTDNLEHVQILACGTSWHAGLIGKYLLEQIAGIPTTVDYASEFRYAPKPIIPNTLTIGVTQSGETADTIAALESERARRASLEPKFQAKLLAITNRAESTIAQICDRIIDTHAGIEIGVAATKTFTAQTMGFYFLALDLAYRRQTIPNSRIEEIIESLRHIPSQIETILDTQAECDRRIGPRIYYRNRRLYLYRTRYQLPHRPRGCAKTQRNFLHPCRSLSRRRNETRTDRTIRQQSASSSRSNAWQRLR